MWHRQRIRWKLHVILNRKYVIARKGIDLLDRFDRLHCVPQFEFLGATIGGGTFVLSYVLCLEWVSAKYRVRASAIAIFLGPLGDFLLGLVAMYYDHYRSFLIFVYTPGLLIIFYPWLVPESARWLIATGQHDAALGILQRAAKNNNTTISEQSYAILRKNCDGNKELVDNGNSESVFDIFKHKTLIIRSIVLAFCWIMVLHIVYGLTLSATKIAEDDNKYLSYIVIMAASFPAALISFSILDYVGRRTTLCGALFTSGAVTLASTLVPDQQTIVIRVLSFIGKCATACASGVLFIFSAEIWPTPLRNRMMNIFCMIGQFGSMLAPLTTLLVSLSTLLWENRESLFHFCPIFCNRFNICRRFPTSFSVELPLYRGASV